MGSEPRGQEQEDLVGVKLDQGADMTLCLAVAPHPLCTAVRRPAGAGSSPRCQPGIFPYISLTFLRAQSYHRP